MHMYKVVFRVYQRSNYALKIMSLCVFHMQFVVLTDRQLCSALHQLPVWNLNWYVHDCILLWQFEKFKNIWCKKPY